MERLMATSKVSLLHIAPHHSSMAASKSALGTFLAWLNIISFGLSISLFGILFEFNLYICVYVQSSLELPLALPQGSQGSSWEA